MQGAERLESGATDAVPEDHVQVANHIFADMMTPRCCEIVRTFDLNVNYVSTKTFDKVN